MVDRIEVFEVDFEDDLACGAILLLMDAYAREPMGMGAPLGRAVRRRLIPALRDHPTARVLLAWNGEVPVGLAVCFLGLSTFEARPLLNLHDLVVHAEYRGMGIGRGLLSEVEALAARGKSPSCSRCMSELDSR